jgi:hypothetical protein
MRMFVLTRATFKKVLTQDGTVAVKLLEYAAALLRRLERPIGG